MSRARLSAAGGQSTVEHAGLVLLLALALAAAPAIVPPVPAAAAIGRAICTALGGDCRPAGGPAGDDAGPVAELEAVERLVDAELEEFLAARAATDGDPRLDWSSDDCSAPIVGSAGASFDFTDACRRHDFGYRNFDRLGVFWERKAAVDERFLADMLEHCDSRSGLERERCRAWARTFHLAVRRLGHLSGHGRAKSASVRESASEIGLRARIG